MKKRFLFSLLLTATSANAALIAHYDFTDGDLLDDEQGTYTLTHVDNGAATVTANPDGSAAFPGNDGIDEAHLQVAGPGGSASFTVSFWMQTSDWTQGNFQGLFSNLNVNAANNFSWQIDSNGGTLRVVSATAGFPALSVDASNFTTDAWHHIVLRKTAAGGTEFYVTEPGAATPTQVGSNTVNPGGLQNFRLGTNRNTDSFFEMDMANVKIYNDANVNLTTLLAEGPQLIPEPSTSLLGLLGALALLRRRR